jgi:rubrerythrin
MAHVTASTLPGAFSLLDLLCLIEETLGKLYLEYARLFPKYAVFWQELAANEQQHAMWLVALVDDFECGALKIAPGRGNVAEYHQLLNTIDDGLRTAQHAPMTHAQAVRFAAHIDSTYILHYLQEVFRSDDIVVCHQLRKLIADSQRHGELLQTMLNQLRTH